MMKLTVVTIAATLHNAAGFKNVQLKREVLASELNSGGNGKRVSIIAKTQFEKTGRVGFVTLDDATIAEAGLKVGDDFNEVMTAAGHPEYAVQVLESTDRDEFGTEIGLSMTEKRNPTNDVVCLSGGAVIFHTTILTSAADFAEDGGDISLTMDQVAK